MRRAGHHDLPIGDHRAIRRDRGSSTFIDLIAKTVHSATLNGDPVDVSGYSEETGIALTGLAAHNELVVDADCLYTNTGEGLHRFVDPTDDAVYLYSQFETADAKRMFACFDQPDLKATFDLQVTAPQDWAVISNADTVQTAAAQPGLHIFRTTPRMSTYLVALIAGPYAVWSDEYTDEHGTIPLRIFCRASLAEYMDADRLFTETKQASASTTPTSGSPTPSASTTSCSARVQRRGDGERRSGDLPGGLRLPVQGHPLLLRAPRRDRPARDGAHVFGDLVTMRWWDDLWLNESFATFASVLCQASATEYTNAWTTFANVEKSWAYRQDQLPSTHPIAADIPDLAAVEVNFDGITYAKGASVLKQLVAYVGQEPSSPVCASTSATTPTATPPSTTCSPRWRRPPAATCRTGVPSGSRPPA